MLDHYHKDNNHPRIPFQKKYFLLLHLHKSNPIIIKIRGYCAPDIIFVYCIAFFVIKQTIFSSNLS